MSSVMAAAEEMEKKWKTAKEEREGTYSDDGLTSVTSSEQVFKF